MKPLNEVKATCVPTSSNCVKWQGPYIENISLCKDASITEVILALSNQLVEIQNAFNISNYDIECLNMGKCGPSDMQELIQKILDSICSLNGYEKQDGVTSVVIENIPECLSPGVDPDGNPISVLPLQSFAKIVAEKICYILNSIETITSTINKHESKIEDNANSIIALQENKLDKGDVHRYEESEQYDIYKLVQENTDNIGDYSKVLGDKDELLQSISDCVLRGENQYMLSDPNVKISDIFNNEQTIASTISNIWAILCDVRTKLNDISIITEEDPIVSIDTYMDCAGYIYYIAQLQNDYQGSVTLEAMVDGQATSCSIYPKGALVSPKKLSDKVYEENYATIKFKVGFTKGGEAKYINKDSEARKPAYGLSVNNWYSGTDYKGVRLTFYRQEGRDFVIKANDNIIFNSETNSKKLQLADPNNRNIVSLYYKIEDQPDTVFNFVLSDNITNCEDSVSYITPESTVERPVIVKGEYVNENDTRNEVPLESYKDWKENYDNLIQ